ncbi:MAG TPA: hypothetical protein VFX73_10450, partial [Chitinophagaceae bacterium]|nr:hypothetical protein [Chitinophagaceae bacterium]
MNPFLTRIKEQILNSPLIEQDRQTLLKSLTEADKQWAITDFKLDRTEKVKKTTAILLEETIEELEKKRQAVEAQNKELEIETSLEKVRAVAMGMNKPEDLVDICETLFKEFRNLGFESLRNAMINIHDDEHSSFVNYDYSDEIGKSITPLVYDIHPVIEKQIREIRSADDAFSETVFSGKDLEDWKTFRRERGEKDDPRIDDVVGLHYYFYSIGSGSIGISTFASIDGDKLALLKRFRNVFILAYQRYTDIAQAAAQAREAQIQLAMERVRARTMAMQKSEELEQCAELLFQQIGELGINAWSAGFSIWHENDTYFIGYNTNPTGGIGAPFRIPLTEDVFFKTIREAKRRGEEFLVFESEGESLAETYRYMDALPIVGDIMRGIVSAGYALPKYQVTHCGFFSEGHLMFITLEPHPEAWDIFKRFTKVFEQTYTRFLDLKKAEAHAREIEIDLALERVRAQTMAMHNSEDVGKCIVKMFGELTALGVDEGTRFGIGILNHDNENIQLWTATKDGEKVKMHIGNLDMSWHPLLQSARQAWQKQVPLHQYVLEGEDLVNYYQMINNAPDYKLRIAIDKLPEREIHYGFVFDHGFFYAFNRREFEPELIRITQRFSSLFGQTYRRYLDLVKAEGQAREAEIELALERVRARTMAMQKSAELNEVASVLFQQIRNLGGKLWGTGFALCNVNEGQDEFWFANEAGVMPPVKIPNSEDDIHMAMLNGWIEKLGYLTFQKEGDALALHYQYLNSLPQVKAFFEPILEAGHQFPTWQQWHAAYFSQGYLLFITVEPYPEPEIFKRFATVFDQTYTRFLDLQKAEAQARESQVQLAMERVRARTMAMQRSEELPEVAALLFQQVRTLGVPQFHCGFNIFEIDDKECIWYPGSADGDILPPCKIPLTEHPVFMAFNESRKRGDELFVYEKEGEYQAGHYRYMLSLPVLGEILQNMLDAGIPFPTFQIDHLANFSHGNLLFITSEHFPEMHDTFKRFAKVFEQTYTRFLDLQKAEAQAREAEIQLALERLRARTMAMHKSDELPVVVFDLFEQMHHLGFAQWGASISLADEARGGFHVWFSTPENRIFSE